MGKPRSSYSSSIRDFLAQSCEEIAGSIHTNDASAQIAIQQTNAWETEVLILKDQLRAACDGRIIFEYRNR